VRDGEAEIDHAHPAVIADEQVIGLDVAVTRPAACAARAARRTGEHLDDLPHRRPRRLGPRGNGGAADELHREKTPPENVPTS